MKTSRTVITKIHNLKGQFNEGKKCQELPDHCQAGSEVGSLFLHNPNSKRRKKCVLTASNLKIFSSDEKSFQLIIC